MSADVMVCPVKGPLLILCLFAIIGTISGQATDPAQTGCAPGSCPSGYYCGAVGSCVPEPSAQGNTTAFIILGCVLGAFLLIAIIITIVACGRWRQWNMGILRRRTAVHTVKRRRPRRTAIRQSRVVTKIPRKRKMNLKLGVTENPYVIGGSDTSNNSRSLFVISNNDNEIVTSEPGVAVTQSSAAGPYVATVPLEYTPGGGVANMDVAHHQGNYQSNTVHSNCACHTATSSTQCNQACAQATGGASTRIQCPDVHSECQVHGRNIDVHAGPAQIYPQLSEVMRPQHQVHIHAPVPQLAPVVHHHQHGIYPNLAHPHTHAQLHHSGHANSAPHLAPPDYETMQRKI